MRQLFGAETREIEDGPSSLGSSPQQGAGTVSENTVVDKSEQAEERTRGTRAFVQSMRRATRRRFTPEEKIRIVLEGFRRETTVNDLCRREGINPANYCSWTKEFMEAGKDRLSRNTVRAATRVEVEQLRSACSLC